MKLGKKYDDTNMIIANAIFDVNCVSCELSVKIDKLEDISHNLYEENRKLDDFKTIIQPDFTVYTQVCNRISDLLFDEMSVYTLKTDAHGAWKEYFHGLYDLILFPILDDNIYQQIAIASTYEYWNILTPPQMLDQTDVYYTHVKTIDLLFKDLEQLHKGLINFDFKQEVRNIVKRKTEIMADYIKVKNTIAKLQFEKDRYTEMLMWSLK